MGEEKLFPYIPMYRNWYEAIQEMETEEQLATYNAIFSYAFDGDCDFDKLPRTVKPFVMGIRGNIDKSIKRYNDGQRGGNAKVQNIIEKYGILGVSDGFIQFESTEKAEAFRKHYKTINMDELSGTIQGKINKGLSNK